MNRKALFLDRDGVINEEKNYVHRVADFEFMNGIFELLAHAQSLNYLLIVITNQAGIARGYYTEKDFHKLNDWMVAQFSANGITINRVYYCPYHPTHGLGAYKIDSDFRKPGPGMILQAQKELNINLAQSVLIGDKESDIEAGLKAGVSHTVLLKSDRYNSEKTKADLAVNSLEEIKPLLNP
jgi:D-glycero-D-manno-heptose 1,7-bisphosphate phosphatase